jgi:molybdenum cofactor cytidylyltransferase
VVLAAGAGRRFGGAKLTAPYRGGVLLDGALGAAFASPAPEIVVVSGCDPAVEPAARAFAARSGQAGRLRLAHAADWEEGLAASLRAGLTAVSDASEGALIFLGDMPRTPHALAARLAEAFGPGVDAVQPTFEGQPGHPVLLGRSLFDAAQALRGDRGAQSILAAAAAVVRLAADAPGVTADIDTPEALAQLTQTN